MSNRSLANTHTHLHDSNNLATAGLNKMGSKMKWIYYNVNEMKLKYHMVKIEWNKIKVENTQAKWGNEWKEQTINDNRNKRHKVGCACEIKWISVLFNRRSWVRKYGMLLEGYNWCICYH